MFPTILLALAGLLSFSSAAYTLQDDYSSDKFFSMFDFFTAADPTNGYVQYVDQNTAQSGGLINTKGNTIYMGVDNTNVASSSGRASVRLTSKKAYNHGLIILDLGHMPGSICGIWPAFWTVGPGWPNSGEIDIIEGVNSQSTNSMTLHTGDGCSISNNGLFSGQMMTPNCDIDAAGQSTNAGCSISTASKNSYGSGFNDANGGVYATEWTGEAISIWFFPRNAIPADITTGSPDPSSWGMATAHFSGGCEIDNFFKDQQIVFDTTFCGDWAGAVWDSDPICSAKAPTCQSFVQNNPSAFTEAYWSINSLKVYSAQESSSSSSPGTAQSGEVVTVSVTVPTDTATDSEVEIKTTLTVTNTVSQPTDQWSGGNGGDGNGRGWGGGRFSFSWRAPNFVNIPNPTGTAAASASLTETSSGIPGNSAVALALAIASDGHVTQVAASASVSASGSAASQITITKTATLIRVSDTAAVSPATTASPPLVTTAAAGVTTAAAGEQNGILSETTKYVTVTAVMNDYFPRANDNDSSKRELMSEQESTEVEHAELKQHAHRHLHVHHHQQREQQQQQGHQHHKRSGLGLGFWKR